jgi:hypothetical protein
MLVPRESWVVELATAFCLVSVGVLALAFAAAVFREFFECNSRPLT